MNRDSTGSIASVVAQHAQDAAALRHVRSVLVRAPHVKLLHLSRHDERLAAHLDGLVVAGPDGWKLAQAALESPGPGETFTAAVLAIQSGSTGALDELLALAEAHPPAARGVVSAFGWVSAQSLRGLATRLSASASAWHRQVGLAACTMHGVDPGAALDRALSDADTRLRARALWAAGIFGRDGRLPACIAALADDDAACRFHAARSAWLLGNRGASASVLNEHVASPGPRQREALGLLLKQNPPAQSHAVLKMMSKDAAFIRTLIYAVGAAGDPHYIPWLIEQMADPKLMRLAGESFSLITGLDLALLDLEVKPPEGIELGPSDDPADDDVAMDEDDSLPWPDAAKIAAWWQAHGARFAAGTRYFMGEPPTPAHCLGVLKTGYQRQRIAAAQYLCLLTPGTPLFNTAQPTWRQQRLLAQMLA